MIGKKESVCQGRFPLCRSGLSIQQVESYKEVEHFYSGLSVPNLKD